MLNYFIENYSNVRFIKAQEKVNGLRNAQLGALHAIGAYYTKENAEKALIVLPTGTGKTAVLMLSPYLVEAKKVLVITPSKLVRNQIASDYTTLKTLKNINVLPELCICPNVFELKDTNISKHIDKILDSDVVVATPQGAFEMSVNESCTEEFDLILIDEAHHEPAKKWREAIDNFHKAKKILFTATPFRLDNKKLKADLIYTYTLSQAYKDKVFGEVSYIPVKIDNPSEKDLKIALEAERVFYEDKTKGLKHSLMVRAGTIEEAEKLFNLYKESTNLIVEKVHSRLSAKNVDQIIQKLRNGELDGVICVDMMAEGFDFPHLKIAAIHSPHKSLAITLQFIGRFARTNATNIDSAKFIAANDEDFLIENEKLFSEDAIWKDIIMNLSDATIVKEEENRDFLGKFTLDNKSKAQIQNELLNMRPNFHAKVYQTGSFDISASFEGIVGMENVGTLTNETDNIVIIVLKELAVPKWATRESNLYDENYFLIVMKYFSEYDLLFINSQLKNESLYMDLASNYCGEDGFKKLNKGRIHRVLGEMNNFEIFNSGLQNRVSNEEAYLISSGPDVGNTYDPATGKLYAAGHVFCKAEKDGVSYTIGYSSGSKIWSSTYGSIKEFIEWCKLCAKKINNEKMVVKTNTTFDFVPISQKLDKFPNTILLIRWSHVTYSNPKTLVQVDLFKKYSVLDIDLKITEILNEQILFSCLLEEVEYKYSMYIDGTIKSEGEEEIQIQYGRKIINLSEYLYNHPLELLTTELSLISDGEIAKNDFEIEKFVPQLINAIDWEKLNVNKKVEFRKTKKDGKISLHEALESILIKDNYDYLIYDHGTEEVADYIGIRDRENEIIIDLFHVKGMKATTFNNSVSDLYDVLGQSIKSVIWLKTKTVLRNKLSARRKSGYCKYLKGSEEDLKTMLFSNKILKAKIIAVQPSVKKDHKMTDKVAELLASTNHYIKHSGSSFQFEVWGS